MPLLNEPLSFPPAEGFFYFVTCARSQALRLMPAFSASLFIAEYSSSDREKLACTDLSPAMVRGLPGFIR